MHRITILFGALLLGVTGLACAPPAEQDDVPAPEPTDALPVDPIETPDADDPAFEEVTGTLGGDPDLEGGCAWIDLDDGTRYEVIYPEGYEIRFEPLELVDPDGEVVATAGDELTLTGQVDPGIVTFCQVGPVFEATEVSG